MARPARDLKHTIVLQNRWALGDTVCLSALVRDIQRAYPGKYTLLMSGHYKNVFWRNNPHCRVQQAEEKGQLVQLAYIEGIKAAGRGAKKHFLSYFHHDFELKTGIKVPVTEPRGDIHFSEDEKRPPLNKRYWVVVAGGKKDMTAKIWYAHRFQETVDTLAKLGIRCVQAGADFNNHFHPRLVNCDQFIGRTNNERELFRLIAHADGVICGVTGAMHIAAVFDKPCVVIAGGREEPWWEAYTNCYYPHSFGPTCKPVKVEHTFLHTIGLLDCCQDKGCWKDRTVPIEQADHVNSQKRFALCKQPVRTLPQAVPLCLDMVTVNHVVEAVMNYYEKGILPPISQPKSKPAEPITLPTDYPLVDETGKQVGRSGDYLRALEMPLGPPPALKGLLVEDLDDRTKQEVLKGGWREHPLPAEAQFKPNKLLDHPDVGGKFTVFVLTYGDNYKLAERCIGSIIDKSPPGRLDLRVAANQVCDKTMNYLASFGTSAITTTYFDTGSRKKYPAMRQMFWDEKHPITTKYVLWFDDDSWVIDKDWLTRLAEEIIQNHKNGCRMYGTKFFHDLMPYRRQGFSPEKWFHAATWWQKRNLFMSGGARETPNGSQIVFCTGGFWALATEVIRKADIPDVRLNHNGGDITIGEQVHQAGFKVKDFCRGKRPVCWSDAPRRGYKEDFPWSKVQ